MRTANPALNADTFTQFSAAGESSHVMTLQGTVNKTGFLCILLTLSAGWVWHLFYSAGSVEAGAKAIMPWLLVGVFGGLIVGLITAFARTWAVVLAPIYAVLEGFFLGGLSAVMEAQFPHIVIQAVGLTFGTLICLLLAYTSRLIRPSENFKLGVAAAMGALLLFYLVSFVLGLFGIGIPYIHDSGPIGIAFSVFLVILASANLVLDFDFIETGAQQGAPKYMEWYAAYGLLVTLVWLYIEILRLLSKLRSRD
ncbi:MAG: Bax inhibitor-1/YccA family protein [Planctomycetes bacterium]|nr:Bax inhibitor-1/YccA family protein [Planctomycetota bacterium]